MADPVMIARLLLDRVETTDFGLPKAMPDVSFTPPADGRYLRVSLFYNAPFWQGLTSGRMDQGLLQITVVTPRGQGVIKPRETANAIMSALPKGTVLVGPGARVKLNREPWAGSPIMDDTETLTVVTIPWVAS